MSVKKIFILMVAGAAALVSDVVFAGGPEILPPPVFSGIYIEGDIGYVNANYSAGDPNLFIRDGATMILFRHNNHGGLTGGGAVGYQFNRYLAAEVGGFYLPSVTLRQLDIFDEFVPARMTSWIGYAAGKLIAPVPFLDNLEVFFKAGVAYRYLKLNSSPLPVKRTVPNISQESVAAASFSNLNPMFATGLQYHFNENWSIEGQWLHVSDGGPRNGLIIQLVPADNLFTFAISYFFRS